MKIFDSSCNYPKMVLLTVRFKLNDIQLLVLLVNIITNNIGIFLRSNLLQTGANNFTAHEIECDVMVHILYIYIRIWYVCMLLVSKRIQSRQPWIYGGHYYESFSFRLLRYFLIFSVYAHVEILCQIKRLRMQ